VAFAGAYKKTGYFCTGHLKPSRDGQRALVKASAETSLKAL